VSRRADVLQQRGDRPRRDLAFHLRARPVLLRLLAHDRDRESRLERDGGDQQHGGALRRAEEPGVGREQAGDLVRDVAQQVGLREETELVEVDGRSHPGGEHEVAVQLGGLDHPPDQVVVHGDRMP
jgi:hypothetical protein